MGEYCFCFGKKFLICIIQNGDRKVDLDVNGGGERGHGILDYSKERGEQCM